MRLRRREAFWADIAVSVRRVFRIEEVVRGLKVGLMRPDCKVEFDVDLWLLNGGFSA